MPVSVAAEPEAAKPAVATPRAADLLRWYDRHRRDLPWRARPGETIESVMRCSGLLYERLWHPVLLAALNTEPRISAASLAAPVLKETLGAGGDACRPVVAPSR